MRALLFFLLALAAFGANAKDCAAVPAPLKQAMIQHISSIRADEYCAARTFKTDGEISVLIYTAEGACYKDTSQKPGTCSTNWVRYMVGEYKDRPVEPVVVGGNGGLEDRQVTISHGVIKINGFTVGSSDPLCCPTVPAVKTFKVSGGRFVVVPP
ncbi:MAG: hypothetical protein ABI135_07485 [Rhodoferax sp.]